MGDGIDLAWLGQNLTSGKPAYGCPHLALWWPMFSRLQILRGRIRECLDVVQAYGFSTKSGTTHAHGTAVDTTQTLAGIVADAREAGARATWCRGAKWGQPNMDDHIHLGLDCPCASGSDYQIAAVDAGYDGLGYRGEGGRDYHPAPKVRRDWAQGMAWMQAEIARLTPTPTPLEDDMPTAKEIADAIVGAPAGSGVDAAPSLGQAIYRMQSTLMRVADQLANAAELDYALARGDQPAADAAIARVRARDVRHPGEPA